MHQHKDWKTYSRFANSLIAEKMEVDSLVACGKDCVKALIDGFQLDLLHFCAVLFISKEKDRNLKSYSSTQHKLYMQEIFGKQEGTTKFYGLVDSESTQEFDQKFDGLKNDLNNRESGIIF